jgi:hypothetical protein
VAQQQSFDLLHIARKYVAAGLSVLPIRRGTKEPASELLPRVYDEDQGKTRPSWRMYQERQPNDWELKSWFGKTDAGIAIVCGQVSGGLVVIDFELPDWYEQWRETVLVVLDKDALEGLPIVATGKGRHVYFRMDDPVSNRKLATSNREVIAETRGQGGYVLAPPSLHPSGTFYELLSGDLGDIPLLDHSQAMKLLDAAQTLAPAVEHSTRSGGDNAGPDVIGTFNSTYTIEHILETHGYTQESSGRFVRPGGERSSVIIVADRSIHYNPNDPLYCEAPGGNQHSHTPFNAWCLLNHNGDVKAAVKAAAHELGLTAQSHQPDMLAQAGRVLGLGEATSDPWPYFLHEGGMWMEQYNSDGTAKNPLLLCNFTARITTETILNDGERQDEMFTISATCSNRSRTIELKRTEFEHETALGRIVAALGARARVNPKTQPKYVLDAIKAFSCNVQETIIHTHTGWVGQRYLLSNGYVDATGWHEGVGGHLPRRLQQYRFTPPNVPMDDVLTLFDNLLTLAPSNVMIPLLGGVLQGPMLNAINAPSPMIHVHGTTGCHKTSITCAAMGLFGDFLPAQPSDTWTSTSNSIQRLGWHLKDMPILLDDYKAANVKPQQVTFLLQNYGDNMARGRLDSNSEIRAAFPIRGILISSGEDQPEGEASTLARILSVQLERRTVDRAKLSYIQQHAQRLHLLTIDYLTWLAAFPSPLNNNELYQATRTAILSRLEAEAEQATNPGRIASNVAVLYAAWHTFGRFLEERGHWSPEQVKSWLQVCKKDLFHLAKAQLDVTSQERYSQIFLETIRSLVASGKAILLNLDATSQEMLTSQVLIGAYDQKGTYLLSQASYDEVCKHLRSAGRSLGISKNALSQMLYQDGFLQNTHPPHLVTKKRINGTRPYCWCLPVGILDT